MIIKNPHPKKRSDHYEFGPRDKEYDRGRQLYRDYKITLAEFDAMHEKQEGRCALCPKFLPKRGKQTHLDHNHKTKKVRGILCAGCNHKLGIIENLEGRLAKYVEYLANDGPLYTDN